MKKPLVLITNDDGVLAPGIRAVADALRAFADVVVAAPDRERSAASHSISLDRPLRVDEIDPQTYAIDGTPVDCVYLALLHLVPRRPALVVSGINNGFKSSEEDKQSGRLDLNQRPPDPQSGALTRLRHAPSAASAAQVS